jgi:hypothetical protein
MFTSNFLHENSKLIFYVYVRDEPRSCCFVVMNICERERERERERYEPFHVGNSIFNSPFTAITVHFHLDLNCL